MLHNISDGKCTFLEAWDVSGETEDGNKVTELVNKAISTAEERFKTEVYAVVSDGASVMKKMGRSVKVWHSIMSISCWKHVC